jgi:DNA-directed RNA polymerase specialized sigma24 family protein
MSLKEIAHALGLPEGTVKSRLFRARARFSEVWTELAD